jgi:hypothetical protein
MKLVDILCALSYTGYPNGLQTKEFEFSHSHRPDCRLGGGVVVRLVRRRIKQNERLSRRSNSGFARTDYVLARARGMPWHFRRRFRC